MSRDGWISFFRQSGWLVMATGLCGVFLAATYPIVFNLPPEEIPIYASLLRLFTVLGIATAGLQVVMAQDAAAAVTEESTKRLAATVRAVGLGILAVWILMCAGSALFQKQIISTFKINNPAAVWVTMGLVLAQLSLPFALGLLQGAQNFAWMGWAIILNGVGRFVGLAVAVLWLKGHSTAALAGALFGLAAAVAAGLWPSRRLFWTDASGFEWRHWFKRVIPLGGGIGAVLFVMNADMLFVQSHFPREQSAFYASVAMIGVGLVTLTTPMAVVMFPKLVSSVARGQRSDSYKLALAGTALLGFSAAIVCTIFPSLPLRIIAFNRPELWVSSQLVPWFMWCMLPVTLANVLINDLLAKQRFAAVPWLVAVAVGYGLAVDHYVTNVNAPDHFAAFKGVILRLGVFSSLLLAIAAFFKIRSNRQEQITG